MAHQLADVHGRGTPESDECVALKRDLLHAFHILDADGQASGIAGHLTARLPGAQTFWSHRWGQGFEEVTYEDLIEADFELNTVTGLGRVNPTLHIHTRIYLARPDVNCIVHTHGTNAVALGVTGAILEPITQTGALFYDDVALFDEYDGVVLGTAEGDAIAEALGPRRGLLLKHHGSLVVGATVREAAIGMMVLEWAAGVQLKAAAAGPLQHLPDEAARQAKGFLLAASTMDPRWAHLVRRIQRARPFLKN